MFRVNILQKIHVPTVNSHSIKQDMYAVRSMWKLRPAKRMEDSCLPAHASSRDVLLDSFVGWRGLSRIVCTVHFSRFYVYFCEAHIVEDVYNATILWQQKWYSSRKKEKLVIFLHLNEDDPPPTTKFVLVVYQMFSKSGVSKLWATLCFCTARGLRIICTFLTGGGKNSEE